VLFVDLFLQYTPSDAAITEKEIKWFWEVVNDLKENEKALLLKFSTGSPCVPAGGFSQLQVKHPLKNGRGMSSHRSKDFMGIFYSRTLMIFYTFFRVLAVQQCFI
jgi:hypothetical protein